MAPEQAVIGERRASRSSRTCAGTSYGLGASLWAILVGRIPHGEAQEPPAAGGGGVAGGAPDRLPGAIEARPLEGCGPAAERAPRRGLGPAIVGHCVAPLADDRYASVRDIQDDLAARRENRPVRPLAGSGGYRLKKFFRRNSALAALGGVRAGRAGRLVRPDPPRSATAPSLRARGGSYVSRAQRAAEDGDWSGALLFYTHSFLISPSDLARWNVAASRAELIPPSAAYDGGSQGVALAPDRKTVFLEGQTGRSCWIGKAARSSSATSFIRAGFARSRSAPTGRSWSRRPTARRDAALGRADRAGSRRRDAAVRREDCPPEAQAS